MNKKKRIVWGTIAATCILLNIIVWILFFPYRTSKVDWNMHGYLVTADGEVKEELEFSVKGEIRGYRSKNKWDRLRLDFTLPDSLPYRILSNAEPGYEIADIQEYFDMPYYVCACSAWDLTYTGAEGKLINCAIAIDPAKEYIIIDWGDGSDQLLVASRNPDVTAEEIWEYFRLFCDLHAKD